MAPMVAQSDAPFRWLGRNHGVDLCFTQMLHAKNIVKDATFRKNHLDFYKDGTLMETLSKSQQLCLGSLDWKPFVWKEGGPLVVQLAGNDVDTMLRATDILQQDNHNAMVGFDVNLGCPQGIARKGNYGAFLMEQDETKVLKMLQQLRRHLPHDLTVSAKIRIPTNVHALEERVLRLQETGIDFITIHGRTLVENKTRTGPCRVQAIAKAIQSCRFHLPVIANGGIETLENAIELQQDTKAHAVMSSEGLLENPTLFDSNKLVTSKDPHDKLRHDFRVAHDYLDYCELYPPLPGTLGHAGGSFNVVRAHLFKMLHCYLQHLPNVRDGLAHNTQTTSLPHARAILHEMEHHYESVVANHACFLPQSSWYRRHWKNSTNGNQQHNVKVRGDDYRQNGANLTMEQRKALLKERIAKLRQERFDKETPQHKQVIAASSDAS